MLSHLQSIVLTATLVGAQSMNVLDTLQEVPELASLSNYLGRFPNFAAQLTQENITLLAPINTGFQNTSQDDVTEALLSYHILRGIHATFDAAQYDYVPTVLASSADLPVSGGQYVIAQGSIWSNMTTFYSGLRSAAFTTGVMYNCTNGLIRLIDDVLVLPQNFTSTYEASPMNGEASPFADGQVVHGGKTTPIDQLSNVTIFLPVSYAFAQIGNLVNAWTIQDLDRILSYHVVDHVLFMGATDPPAGKFATYQGEDLTISTLDGVTYVNSAKVVGSPNWLSAGGMIYSIYGVLNPDNTTIAPTEDSSGIAFAGAAFTSNYAFPASDTGTSGSNGGGGLSTGAKAGIGVAVAVAIILAALMAFWVWHRRRARRTRKEVKYQYPLVEWNHQNVSQRRLTDEMG